MFKATWKGTVVAVKIMVLPSYMTGKEKREKMAVMETAISSSLSHPNVVQTFTYTVEPVRSNTGLSDRSHASGPAASMHDSTFSWGHEVGARNSNESDKDDNGAGKDHAVMSVPATSCTVQCTTTCCWVDVQLAKPVASCLCVPTGAFSWEVRLVQEFCDLGSLKDSLRQGKFRYGVLTGYCCFTVQLLSSSCWYHPARYIETFVSLVEWP